MAAPSNLSFEATAGVTPPGTGAATGWTLAVVSTYEEMAEFGAAVEPWERFETEWLSNEDYLFAFEPSDLGTATYGTALVDFIKTVENFEELWLGNESYLLSLDSPEPDPALYDVSPEEAEDFNEGWDSNESFMLSFVGVGTDLEAAVFDAGGTPADFETFESGAGWSAGYLTAFVGVGTDLTAAVYNGGGGSAFDDFETFQPLIPVALDTSNDHVVAIAHPMVGSQYLTFIADIYPQPLQANMAYYVHASAADWFTIGLDAGVPGDVVFLETPVGALFVQVDPALFWVDGMVTTAF